MGRDMFIPHPPSTPPLPSLLPSNPSSLSSTLPLSFLLSSFSFHLPSLSFIFHFSSFPPSLPPPSSPDKLYAIGGETTAHTYKSVEAYDPHTGLWSNIPDMHIARSGAGACSVNGKLYVVGGQDRAIHHSTMECYDPAENCWHLCANMRHPRSGVAAVVHDKYIYAIGGRDRHRQAYYDIVERFSPEMNVWETFNR